MRILIMNSRPSAILASVLILATTILSAVVFCGGMDGVMQYLSIYEIVNRSKPYIVYEDIAKIEINMWSRCITDNAKVRVCTYSSAHPTFAMSSMNTSTEGDTWQSTTLTKTQFFDQNPILYLTIASSLGLSVSSFIGLTLSLSVERFWTLGMKLSSLSSFLGAFSAISTVATLAYYFGRVQEHVKNIQDYSNLESETTDFIMEVHYGSSLYLSIMLLIFSFIAFIYVIRATCLSRNDTLKKLIHQQANRGSFNRKSKLSTSNIIVREYDQRWDPEIGIIDHTLSCPNPKAIRIENFNTSHSHSVVRIPTPKPYVYPTHGQILLPHTFVNPYQNSALHQIVPIPRSSNILHDSGILHHSIPVSQPTPLPTTHWHTSLPIQTDTYLNKFMDMPQPQPSPIVEGEEEKLYMQPEQVKRIQAFIDEVESVECSRSDWSASMITIDIGSGVVDGDEHECDGCIDMGGGSEADLDCGRDMSNCSFSHGFSKSQSAEVPERVIP